MVMRLLIIVILSFFLSGLVYGQLHHFSIEQSGGGPIPDQTAGIPLFIQIVAQDSVNSTISGFEGTVDVSSDGILSSGSGTSSSFTDGVLDSHLVVFSNTGSFSITAIQTAGTFSGTSNTFDVVAGAPFQLEIIQQPTSTIAGTFISPSVTVQLKDNLGNDALVEGTGVSVSFLSGTGTLSGTTTRSTNTQGIATFDDVFITTAGSKTLAVSSSGLVADTSTVFSITPDTLHHFLVGASSGGIIPTQVVETPLFIQIVALDSFENTVNGFTGTVDISSDGTLSTGNGPTASFTGGILDSHLVAFSNIGLVTITATQTGGTITGSSNAFNVVAGAPFQLFIVQQPSSTSAGNVITPPVTVQLRDSLGNNAPESGINISLTLVSGTGTLNGTTIRATDAQGLATFDDLSISASGTKTILASSSGLVSDTSDQFSIAHEILHHFLVESSAGGIIPTQIAGNAFLLRVTAQDTFNNTTTSFTGTVDISSSGNLTAGIGTTASFISGVLSSHSITISPGGNFTITATQTGGSVNGTSNLFTVNNLAPSTSGISPTSKTTGETGFTLTVNGSDFVTTSVVRFNGSDRATTFVNSTQLTAAILGSDIDTAGSFSITVFTSSPGGGTSGTQTLLVNPPVVNTKAYLEGALTGSTMTTALRSGNFIPLSQPYGSSPFTYSGTESVASIPADVVDWVLLELRTGTAPTTRVARRAAFIKNDGTIVDLNGSSPVTFPTASIGNYFLAIQHRNHLAIMTSSAIALDQSSALYDFTTGLSQYFGSDAKSLGGGRFGMYAGDYSSDGFMDAADFIGPDNDVFLDGYRQSDLNLDGFVDISDFVFPDNNVFLGTNVPN